jgi:hypothetical protein
MRQHTDHSVTWAEEAHVDCLDGIRRVGAGLRLRLSGLQQSLAADANAAADTGCRAPLAAQGDGERPLECRRRRGSPGEQLLRFA